MSGQPSRLDAIADLLLGFAESVHGEFGGGPFERSDEYDVAVAALHALGVTGIAISAARRKRDRDIREYYRQQREEVAH